MKFINVVALLGVCVAVALFSVIRVGRDTTSYLASSVGGGSSIHQNANGNNNNKAALLLHQERKQLKLRDEKAAAGGRWGEEEAPSEAPLRIAGDPSSGQEERRRDGEDPTVLPPPVNLDRSTLQNKNRVSSQIGNRKPSSSASKSIKNRKGGRDGADHSHMGMEADEDGINVAWGNRTVKHRCHGMTPRDECIDNEAIEWFRKHVLMAIVTGKEGSFRVEVSQCSWLGHFPPENVYCFSDVIPTHTKHTPHHWVAGVLPEGVEERDGDIFSHHITKGYVREVRKAGQGYSAGWIVAQFRFPQALDHLLKEATRRKNEDGSDIKWIMIIDDDTIVNLNHLVKRLSKMSVTEPWYLSRRGWGGAGHLYSLEAMSKTRKVLHECIDKWMVRQFRASDTMLLKCATHAKLNKQLEHTMSHCPASRAGVEKMLSDTQVTFHGKKDYYPPVILTTFRVGLYYLASYCRNKKAAELAVWYSSCAFGNCKIPSCSKEHDKKREQVWLRYSKNHSITAIPWDDLESVPTN